MTRPTTLPCSRLDAVAGLNEDPMMGNWCRVLMMPVPSEAAPMKPKMVTTTSNRG